MKILSKIRLFILFGVIIWIALFAPIDTNSTIELFLTCYGMAILLAIAFIYVDKKKEQPKGFKKIFFYSIFYGTICFLLFWII
tara:strand:- start:597 stop:845 length:249 start_codon:yes stop_codon:yes gene_type:complete